MKSEAIIISNLSYCLEITSIGQNNEMERLQGVPSATARWNLDLNSKKNKSRAKEVGVGPNNCEKM